MLKLALNNLAITELAVLEAFAHKPNSLAPTLTNVTQQLATPGSTDVFPLLSVLCNKLSVDKP